jgi:hypothetical protein
MHNVYSHLLSLSMSPLFPWMLEISYISNDHTSPPLILTGKLSDLLGTSTLSGILSVGIEFDDIFDE